MKDIYLAGQALASARLATGLSQQELADRVGTAQASVARLERGSANSTIETLARYAHALDCEWRLELVPRTVSDPVVERYKTDVDRTLLRENLTRSADERIRSLADWQRSDQELTRAMRRARRG